jgi:uncharacterized protein (DUF983 family)
MSQTLPFFLNALRGYCPRCQKGKMFGQFLKLVDVCPVCALPLAKNDNGDGPAVFLIFILGFSVVPLAIFVSMHVAWPLWVHGLIWGVVILGCTIGMLQPAKALTIAMQYKHRPDTFE